MIKIAGVHRQSESGERVRLDTEPDGSPGVVELRARVVWIALTGVIPLALFVQWSDVRVGGTISAGPFPPLAACWMWALLVAVNALLARFRGTPVLERRELLIVFGIWAACNVVAGRGLLHPMLASIVGPMYYARGRVLTSAITAGVPNWLAITDKATARAFYEGHGVHVPWGMWRAPLITWSLFFLPFLTANVCLCALFERVWTHEERLAFPVVALPLEAVGLMASGSAGSHLMAESRLPLLIGLAIPILLHGFGVANAYLPGVPSIPVYNDISDAISSPPWSAIKPLYVNFYPILVGLTFLAPTDVTCSVWFFLLFNKLQLLVTAMMGWNDAQVSSGAISAPPYMEEQSAGAYLALAAVLIWNARIHLRGIAGGILGKPAEARYRTYRPLAWGFVLGTVGVLAWLAAVGFPLWFAALYFAFLLAVALVLGRLMAEGGVPWLLAPILPDKLILSLVGSAVVRPLVLTRLMFSAQFLRDTRQMFAPAVLEGGKLRTVSGAPLRGFYGLLLVSVLGTLVVGGLTALPIFYAHGAASLQTNNDGLLMTTYVMQTGAVSQAASRLSMPINPNPASGVAVVVGAAITILLSALRLRYFWWPLHPLGYALTGTLQTGYANKMLLSIFIGWALKCITLRFGGVKGFRYLRGAAFGLILGDLAMAGVVKALDALLGPSGYAAL